MTDESRSANATGPASEDFARQAENSSTGLFREYVDFLRTSKKWWLTPIILVLLLFGVIIALGGGVVAPFIYTLF